MGGGAVVMVMEVVVVVEPGSYFCSLKGTLKLGLTSAVSPVIEALKAIGN